MGEDIYGYYDQLAEQERARQRSIAKYYMSSTPSIGNLYNAAQAFWNSLPIVGITSSDVNPYMNQGVAPTPGRVPAKLIGGAQKLYKTLDVATPFKNYVANPAERAAAMDYIQELKRTGQYKQFLERNPGYKIDTQIRPGVSEDWSYPNDVMIKHGLRKPVVKQKPAQQQVTVPKKTAQQRSRQYYREKVEDREQRIFKTQRKAFNAQRALEDGDMRHVNAGRPSMAKIRLADQHIHNYSQSSQGIYHKLRLKAAKKGYNTDEMLSLPEIKEFLRNLIETEGHRF